MIVDPIGHAASEISGAHESEQPARLSIAFLFEPLTHRSAHAHRNRSQPISDSGDVLIETIASLLELFAQNAELGITVVAKMTRELVPPGEGGNRIRGKMPRHSSLEVGSRRGGALADGSLGRAFTFHTVEGPVGASAVESAFFLF